MGWPGVPDHVSLWGLLIPIRRVFDQYVNLRPCRLMPGHRTPLADRTPADIDFYVVRENTEGEYCSVGGRMFEGTDREFVSQQSVLTRVGIDRILRYAFELAMTRPREALTCATKCNGIPSPCPTGTSASRPWRRSIPTWRRTSSTSTSCARTSSSIPDWFDVVVGSNLFGDILSDLGPAVAGSIGIAPCANINPERRSQHVRAGARLRAGHRRQAHRNPIGQIWSGAMMLQHLGHAEAARRSSERSKRCLGKTARAPATWAAKPARRTSARRWRSWSGGDEGADGRSGTFDPGHGHIGPKTRVSTGVGGLAQGCAKTSL